MLGGKGPLMLGSDQAKSLLFQGLFARERCYLALEPHFPYRNARHKAAPALEDYTNVRHQNLAMLGWEKERGNA
jgi:hypothetical protein